MQIELLVKVNGMYFTSSDVAVVPELMREVFEPLKTCSEPLVAYCTGDKIAESFEVRKVIKAREDSAKILAEQLTAMILSHMQKEDTINGYTKDQS